MNKSKIIALAAALFAAPTTFGQTIYKCPSPDGTVKFSQTPCGGEAITINAPKPSGDGLRDSERAYLEDRDKARQQQASQAAKPPRSGEVEAECLKMRERVLELEHRSQSGVHTYSLGVDDAILERQKYERLCN